MAELLYPPSVNALTKTLDTQLDEGVTASMTLNNTTNIQNKPGVVVINRIDTDGNEQAASVREYIKFTAVSGSTLTGLTRAQGGSTDQDHAVGSVVEFINDITQQQALLDVITTEHGTDGTHDNTTVALLAGAQTFTGVKTLASPVINTGVSGTAIKDEDNMASDSATHLATQQSIKAYVDANTGGVATDAIFDAKGDLAVGTGADTAQKLTVGTDGYSLVAASGETTGIKWGGSPRVYLHTDAGTRSSSSYLSVTETSYTAKCNVMINGDDLLDNGYTQARLVAHLGYASGGTMYTKLIIGANESEVSASSNSRQKGAWIALADEIGTYEIQCKLASSGTSYLYGTLFVEIK